MNFMCACSLGTCTGPVLPDLPIVSVCWPIVSSVDLESMQSCELISIPRDMCCRCSCMLVVRQFALDGSVFDGCLYMPTAFKCLSDSSHV